MLAVTDQEVEFFKKDVEDFSDIDKQIKELKNKIKPIQEKIKELTQKKKAKQEEVMDFMTSNGLDVCNSGNTSLEVKNSTSTKSVTKGDAYDRIYKFFSEDNEKIAGMNVEEKAKFLHNYIYVEGREKIETKKLIQKT